MFSRQYHLITRDDRLDKIAEDVVRHFAGRGYRGKAMYIAIDKATALRMHDKVRARWHVEIERLEKALVSLSGEERAAQEAKIAWMKATDMAVIVSAGQNEKDDMAAKGLDIVPHRRRMNTEDMEAKFKDPDDPFRLVFLCAMWLTGFDAPSCSTIYLDKPMKNHTLMQTIARANRVCGDKEAGLTVDYVGVFRNLQRALAIYARGTGSGEMPIKDKAALLTEFKKALDALLAFAEAQGVTPAPITQATGLARLKALADATDALLFERQGEITPPCGEPSVVRRKKPSSTAPAFSHLSIILRMTPSVTRWSRNARRWECEIESKYLRMSISSTQ